MWMECLSEPEGDSDKCPTCGGHVRRRQFGEMHAGSFILDGERVDIRKRPPDGYADPVYLDPLTQYFDGGLYRLWPSERYLSRGGRKLHRDAWIGAFGPVPKGCHIHHRDDNVLNNGIRNLECMPASLHLSNTWRNGPRPYLKSDQHFTDAARAKAAEWHRSDAGRLWHRRNAQNSASWKKWKREPRPCDHCGKTFDAMVRNNAHPHRFCTEVCKAASYRARRRAERDG